MILLAFAFAVVGTGSGEACVDSICVGDVVDVSSWVCDGAQCVWTSVGGAQAFACQATGRVGAVMEMVSFPDGAYERLLASADEAGFRLIRATTHTTRLESDDRVLIVGTPTCLDGPDSCRALHYLQDKQTPCLDDPTEFRW